MHTSIALLQFKLKNKNQFTINLEKERSNSVTGAAKLSFATHKKSLGPAMVTHVHYTTFNQAHSTRWTQIKTIKLM